MELLKLGFTGTQEGMTARQLKLLERNLHRWMKKYTHLEVHHGDCIGADAEFHEYSTELWYPGQVRVVLHPPTITTKRAYCSFEKQTEEEPLPFLDRNRAIVDSVDGMLAGPRTVEEELRSGTWATVRYARKTETPLIILPPA